MNNVAEEIQELINATGKPAPDMTKALKSIGGGDMQEGIKKLAAYFTAIGNQNGWIKGSLTTLGVVALAAGGMYIKDRYAKYKRRRDLEQEGRAILAAIKETIPSANVDDSGKGIPIDEHLTGMECKEEHE